MNQSFRVIFQAASGTYVAVSELTKSKGKTKSSRALRHVVVAGMLALGATSAMASEACTTEEGQTGTLDSLGACNVVATNMVAPQSAAQTRAITPLAATTDQYLKVNAGGSNADAAAVAVADIAIGVQSKADSTSTESDHAAVAIGYGTQAIGARAIATGMYANATGTDSIATGYYATAAASAVAIGSNSEASRTSAIALGNDAKATGIANDIAIGNGATATGHATIGGTLGGSALAIGNAATATGYAAIALGLGSSATGDEGAALGYGSVASNTHTTAIGAGATASGLNSSALGFGAIASHQDAIALGRGAVTDRDDSVSIGSATLQRQLTNLAAGTEATDAANFGQLKATGASIADALGGGSVVNANGTITTPAYTLLDGSTVTGVDGVVNNFDQRVTDLAGAIGDGTVGLVQQDAATRNISVAAATGGTSVDFTGTDGARSLNGVANGVVAAGSLQAINGGQLFQMQADWDQKLQDLTTGTIGDFQTQLDRLNGQVSNQGVRLDAIEQGIADGTIGGGDSTTNPANGNSQIGTGAIASGKDATAIGNGAIATGDNSTATGTNSTASGSNSTATGANSVASGSNSTANGANAKATGENSTALGANSSATGSNSVAIGEGSVADRDNSVSFGSAGNERQLTNVADGTAPTDAVNKRQLDGAIAGVNDRIDRLDTRVDEMGAMSSAQAQMAMSTAGLVGNNRLGVGIGAQNGQSALALGYQRVYGQGTRTLSFGGAASTRGTVSFGAGAGFAW